MEFIPNKCHVTEMSETVRRPVGIYSTRGEIINKSSKEKYVGVVPHQKIYPMTILTTF